MVHNLPLFSCQSGTGVPVLVDFRVGLAQARHRAPKLEVFLRGLEDRTREVLLREMKGMLRELYAAMLRVFGA